MIPHANPIMAICALSGQSGTYRGMLEYVLDHGYDGWARDKVVPKLRATHCTRIGLIKFAGYAATDESNGNDSFRSFSILSKERPWIARTLEPALDLICAEVDEVMMYPGDPILDRLVSSGLRAFLENLSACFGPIMNHPKVSLCLGASGELDDASLAEAVFQVCKRYKTSGGRAMRVYREGPRNCSRPGPDGDHAYITWDSYSKHRDPSWFDASKIGELVVQEPEQPTDGSAWSQDKAWLRSWIDSMVSAGVTAGPTLDNLDAMGVDTRDWMRR